MIGRRSTPTWPEHILKLCGSSLPGFSGGRCALLLGASMQMRTIMALLMCLLPSAAFAEAKIALLIGNQAYDASVGVLKNSYNDIAVVGEALRALNFDVLPPMKDASRSAILRAHGTCLHARPLARWCFPFTLRYLDSGWPKRAARGTMRHV
jgi:hypothetical protein